MGACTLRTLRQGNLYIFMKLTWNVFVICPNSDSMWIEFNWVDGMLHCTSVRIRSKRELSLQHRLRRHEHKWARTYWHMCAIERPGTVSRRTKQINDEKKKKKTHTNDLSLFLLLYHSEHRPFARTWINTHFHYSMLFNFVCVREMKSEWSDPRVSWVATRTQYIEQKVRFQFAGCVYWAVDIRVVFAIAISPIKILRLLFRSLPLHIKMNRRTTRISFATLSRSENQMSLD